jgi:hypothetical protein
MDRRRITQAAEAVVSGASTEDELVCLISVHVNQVGYGGQGAKDSLEQQVAREVVKRAYQKLSTIG